MSDSQDQLLRVIQRSEERDGARDNIGNFETQHTIRRWDGSLYRPTVDELLITRFPTLRDSICWPDGKRFAACLTHDVDSVQLNSRFELLRTVGQHIGHSQRLAQKLRHILSLSGLRRSPREIDIFTPWLTVEKKFGFQSTFFVFPTQVRIRHVIDNVYRWDDTTTYRGESCSVRGIMRDLHRRDCDVGLHGSYLSATSYDMIAEQKEDLEEALGATVIANRQHNLHFDAGVTPGILEKAGLKVDSTLGFNRDIGFRAGTSYPFRMWDLAGERWLGITEIPLVLHDGALLRPDNLDLDPESAVVLCKRLIDRVIETKGVITLLWHPESIARPGWFGVYEKLLKYINEQNGWGASARQIYEWWTSQGLDGKLQRMLDALSRDQMSR
jgi:peptidoglycan/xylan/chitin deacetylase (PgdA/CDA1 family)